MTKRDSPIAPMRSQRVEGICVADPEADCASCDLNEHLVCNFTPSLSNRFLWGNVLYRVLATAIAILAGLLTEQWWMAIVYVTAVLATFTVIEPRLLCSHCPFYAKAGRVLACWALRGMPKLWRYRPEPISRLERTLMLIVGGFIDLFPFAVAGYGVIVALVTGLGSSLNIALFVLLLIITVGFSALAGYFDKLLRRGICKRCPNFSCAMNKVPEEIRHAFLEKNPTMGRAWEERPR